MKENDYKELLKLVEKLMNQDPDPDSEEGRQLKALANVIRDYEENNSILLRG